MEYGIPDVIFSLLQLPSFTPVTPNTYSMACNEGFRVRFLVVCEQFNNGDIGLSSVALPDLRLPLFFFFFFHRQLSAVVSHQKTNLSVVYLVLNDLWVLGFDSFFTGFLLWNLIRAILSCKLIEKVFRQLKELQCQ